MAVKTVRAGLIGAGIQGSRSPHIHVEEGRAQGLDYAYDLLDLDRADGRIDALGPLIDEAERSGYAGLNVTHPCKQLVIPLLTELSPEAQTLGAVNTIVFRNGARIGHNTDWFGFSESLRRGLPDAAVGRVMVIGGGGGGAAVAYALLKAGATWVGVFDIDQTHAFGLVERLRRRFARGSIEVVERLAEGVLCSDGVVNCTPIGMDKYPGLPLQLKLLQERQWVADIVYVPIDTDLLKGARARGCAVLDGGGMAVFQAGEAFRLFTGRTPDYERMLRCLSDAASVNACI
jgi:shikimate dehydrogenase